MQYNPGADIFRAARCEVRKIVKIEIINNEVMVHYSLACDEKTALWPGFRLTVTAE